MKYRFDRKTAPSLPVTTTLSLLRPPFIRLVLRNKLYVCKSGFTEKLALKNEPSSMRFSKVSYVNYMLLAIKIAKSKHNEMKPKTAKIFTESYIKGQTFKDVLSKRDIWQELEKMYNGSLNASTSISGDVAALTLEIQYKNHSLILKETDAMPLKIEVRFNLTKKHEFNIYLKDWTDKILSLFGAKSIKTGDVEFDNIYSIQSKDPEFATTFLKDPHISEKIVRNNLYSLILSYDDKTHTHTLLTVKDRNTKDVEALKELVDLEFRIIDSFIKQGLIHC